MTIVTLPDDTEREGLEEGFYRDSYNNRILYLLKKKDDWYFQFQWTERPVLITKKTMPFRVEKVDPSSDLEINEQDRRFIESKLVSLAEKKP